MTPTIDDFFKPTSIIVARDIIGMQIEGNAGKYTISGTKPYLGESKQTANRPRYMHGSVMMFNMRGSPHFCISTGEDPEQDYFLIHNLIGEDGSDYNNAKHVSNVLGMDMIHDGGRFSDFFNLVGSSLEATFENDSTDASTCLGVYKLSDCESK